MIIVRAPIEERDRGPYIPVSGAPSVAVAHRALLRVRRTAEEDGTKETTDGAYNGSCGTRIHPRINRDR